MRIDEPDEPGAEPPSRASRRRAAKAAILAAGIVALLLRLVTWPGVFSEGRVLVDGTDGYYHLRRGWVALNERTWPPQVDRLMSVPEGARVQWPPLHDALLALVALPFAPETREGFARIAAFVPPVLGALQVLVLGALVLRLGGPIAAATSAALAAVLPGAARYGLLGAIDHDPLIELGLLLALLGVASTIAREPRRGPASTIPAGAPALAAGLLVLVLTWAGCIMQLGVVALVSLACGVASLRAGASRARRLGAALAVGSAAATAGALPFVLTSVWTRTEGATFMGLSWLQLAAVLFLAPLGAAMSFAGMRRAGPADRPSASPAEARQPARRLDRLALALGGLGLLALVALLPSVLPPLVEGVRFLGRGEPFLENVAESRPLLALQGRFDLAPLAVRLSALPLLSPVVIPWLVLRTRKRSPAAFVATAFVVTWLVITLAVALVQSRYSHGAALATAALAGVLVAELVATRFRLGRAVVLRPPLAAALALVILLPCLAAWIRVPAFESLCLRGRTEALVVTGMDRACAFLDASGPPPAAWDDPSAPCDEAVLAPWWTGHWIHWLARRGTVSNPFGPQGQPGFREGMLFYYLDDAAAARDLLERHRVRWVVVFPHLPPIERDARMLGLDAGRWLRPTSDGPPALRRDAWARLISTRLAHHGTGALRVGDEILEPLAGYRHALTVSAAPAGEAEPTETLLRVYEVVRATP